MKTAQRFFEKFFRILGSRVALNIYFWFFLYAIKLGDADDQTAYSPGFYYGMMVFYMLFFALLSYVNNLVLLPVLLFRKKRLLYFLSVLLLIFCISFVYTFFIKWMPIVFPGFDSMQVSIVMSPGNTDISVAGILADIETYFFSMLIWTIIFTMLGYYHFATAKTKRLEEQINKHRETELAFIKNQMNPHFLFNTLNNLYALSIKKADETPEVILQLSTILRYILYESDIPLVSFDKEKEIIQAYIDIELLRIPQTPYIQFSIMADKPYQIPPLLWLAPLENVFKHSRSVNELEIDFRLTIKQNMFLLYCKNNFKPLAPHSEKQTGGLGLSNLTKRLEWLYPGKHTLKTEIAGNYFIIDLAIELS
jgi:two-component system LytT family sensor kinase